MKVILDSSKLKKHVSVLKLQFFTYQIFFLKLPYQYPNLPYPDIGLYLTYHSH